MDVKALTTEDLRQIADSISGALERRQAELQQTCSHAECVDIMHVRPGATHIGCEVRQRPAPAPMSKKRSFRSCWNRQVWAWRQKLVSAASREVRSPNGLTVLARRGCFHPCTLQDHRLAGGPGWRYQNELQTCSF